MAAVAVSSGPVRRSKTISMIAMYALLLVLACFFLFPIVFMVVSSLKADEGQILRDMSSLAAFIPYGNISLQNYQDVFSRLPFLTYVINSLIVTLSIVVLGLFVNSLIAYALARIAFRGRAVLLAVIVGLIVIPFESVAVPLLLMVNRMPWIDGSASWLDSYHVQIIPFIADAFSIYLFYQFFIGLPKDLEEAAFVDGAGRFRIYAQVMVPLSRPVFATVAILQFLAYWGAFLWPLMTTRGDDFRPLTVAMQTFFGQAPRQWGDIMAFASMVTLPVLAVFLVFQQWFVRSVSSFGVKG